MNPRKLTLLFGLPFRCFITLLMERMASSNVKRPQGKVSQASKSLTTLNMKGSMGPLYLPFPLIIVPRKYSTAILSRSPHDLILSSFSFTNLIVISLCSRTRATHPSVFLWRSPCQSHSICSESYTSWWTRCSWSKDHREAVVEIPARQIKPTKKI